MGKSLARPCAPTRRLSVLSRGTNHGKTAVNFAIPHFHRGRTPQQQQPVLHYPTWGRRRGCVKSPLGSAQSTIRVLPFPSSVYYVSARSRVCYEWVFRRCDTFADSEKGRGAERATNDAEEIRDAIDFLSAFDGP